MICYDRSCKHLINLHLLRCNLINFDNILITLSLILNHLLPIILIAPLPNLTYPDAYLNHKHYQTYKYSYSQYTKLKIDRTYCAVDLLCICPVCHRPVVHRYVENYELRKMADASPVVVVGFREGQVYQIV